MKTKMLSKALAVAVIILFLGLAIQPSVAFQSDTEIDIEPKDYLFQTIIDIANNPDVKELLEQYKPEMFKVDIDKKIYRKLLMKNPRLFFNALFTYPSISIEYLDKTYKKGFEISKIVGEDTVLEVIESFMTSNTKFIDEINHILSNNDSLSNKIGILKEMNKDANTNLPFINHPIVCGILFIIAFAISLVIGIEFIIHSIFISLFGRFSAILFLIEDITVLLLLGLGGIIYLLGCSI